MSEWDLLVMARPMDSRVQIGAFRPAEPGSVEPRFSESVEISSLSLTSDSLNYVNLSKTPIHDCCLLEKSAML